MKALVVTNKEQMEVIELSRPAVKANEVLIKVAYCGICGSDIPRYFEGAVHQFPQVLGHEFSGTVVELGEQVTEIKVNSQVAVAPLIPCEDCEQCNQGNPAMCSDYSFIGSRQQGAMAEYVAVPAMNCLNIPTNLDLIQAALVEPLTVAIHGIERVSLKAGELVMVLGSGTIGLLTLLALKAKGVGQVIMVDINQHKLDLAKELGADVCINPKETSLSEYFSDHTKATSIIETAGSSHTQRQAIEFVEKKGNVVFVGTSTNEVVYAPEVFEKILRGELNITGAWMSYTAPFPGYQWQAAIDYLATGRIDVNPLVTGIYNLSDQEKPFNEMVKTNSDQVKLLYKIDEGAN